MATDDGRPGWVWLGLLYVDSRASAWAYFWLCLVLAVGSVGLGFVEPVAFLGGLFVVAALWYLLAIRWVDRHGRWGNTGRRSAAPAGRRRPITDRTEGDA